MRFFVTGISGFAGVSLAAHLIDRGHLVFGAARETQALPQLHERYGERFPSTAVEICDIRDGARQRAALSRAQPDGVFHLAGVAFVPHTIERPELAYEVNFLGSVELLAAVRDVVRGYVALFEKATSGEAYSLGSGKSTSVRSILERLRGLCRVPIEVETDPKKVRSGEIPRIVASNAKIESATGWRPQIALERSEERR